MTPVRLAKSQLAEYHSTPQALPYLSVVEGINLVKPKNAPINWTRIGVITAMILGGFGFLAWYDRSRLPDMIASQDAGLSQKMGNLDGKIDLLLDTFLKRAATSVGSELPRDLDTAKQVLATAKQNGVVLNPATVIEVGQKLVYKDSQEPLLTPLIWSAATDFIEYRSFLNAKLGSSGFKAGQNNQIGSTYSDSVIVRAAIKLDRTKAINNLFRDCIIEYDGGPTSITDSEFDNCKFKISNNANGKRFASTLLATQKISFDPSLTAQQYPQ
jgi:hypothetical protein